MRRGIVTSLATLALWWGVGISPAAAQFNLGQPPSRVRPTVNPAINIGAGGAFSYFGYIKPQADATRNILALQQTLGRMNPDGTLQGQLDQGKVNGAVVGLQTGHPATFFNTSRYYPNTPPMGVVGLGGTASFGTGLGGFTPGGGGGYGFGTGAGGRTFFPGVMNQGFQP